MELVTGNGIRKKIFSKYFILILIMAIIATSCRSFIPDAGYISGSEYFAARPTVTQPATTYDADVVVVGSSVAGWSAALASGRRGIKTILITETSCFGGQAGCAGVGSWDGTGFGSINQLLINNTQDEYRAHDVRLGGCYGNEAIPYSGDIPRIAGRENFLNGDAFCPNPDVVSGEMKALLDMFNIPVIGPVDVLSIGVDGTVVTAEGTLTGRVVIEATETGELIPATLRHPVDALCKQHSTWVADIKEPGTPGNRIGDLTYPVTNAYMTKLSGWWVSGQYHWAGLTGQEGLPIYRRSHQLDGAVTIGLNWMNDGATAEESKDLTMQQLVFLGSHGYQDWVWSLHEIPYTRTSDYRLNGEAHLGATVRGVDTFPDSVALGMYPADYHGTACPQLEASEPFGTYDVPLGIGVPATRVPILVAMGRSGDISDVRATSFRMQPNEVDFGEAIGTLASLAVEQNVLPQDVPIEDVRGVLQFFGSKVDVP